MANQRKLGAILSYVYLVLNSTISILYTPLMLRLMGQSEYGLYTLVTSVIAYLSALDMGFGNAMIRYLAKFRAADDKKSEYKLNGLFLLMYTVIGIIAFFIGITICSKIDIIFGKSLVDSEIETAKVLMFILVVNIAVSFPMSIFTAIITAYEHFILPRVLNIAKALLMPGVMIPLLFMGYKSVALVVVTTVINLSILLINMFYCFLKLKIKIKIAKPDGQLLKEIFTYSFFILLNIVVDKIYLSTDKFILGIVSGTVTVAIYGVAMQLYDYYIMFSTSISGVFLPRITSMITRGCKDKEISDLFIKIGRIQFLVMALILSGFVCVGQEFVIVWAGEAYKDVYVIDLILMIPAIVPLIQNIGITVLQAKNMHRFRSIIYFIIAIGNIFISIPLAKEYGGVGAAIGTAVMTCLGQIIIMNIYYKKKAGIDILAFWKSVFSMIPPVIVTIIMGLGINQLWKTQGYMYILIKGIICITVYAVLMWIFSMNDYEKNLVRKPINKILLFFRRNEA